MVGGTHEELQSSEGDTKHYLHLKEVEITFKHDRPKRGFKVILDVHGDRAYESDVFKKTDEIRWKKGIYLKATAIIKLTLKVLYGTRMKMNIPENYARATLDLAKRTPLGDSREIFIEDDPQAIIKITFGDPLPLEAVVRLLGDETTSALESKVELLEKTETALSVSELLFDLVGAAGQAVPGGDAITHIAKTVFERCKKLNEAHNTAIIMMDNIIAFLPLLKQLRARVEERETKAYLDKLLELIKDILDVLSKYSTSSHTGTSFYMRNWVNSKKATFDGLQKRVDEMRKNINSYLQAKTERNTTEILDNQQKQLLDTLNPVSNAVYYDPNRGCLEGTRKKVLSDILGRLESEGNGPTACWIRGPAGIGKSTISISLAEILKKSGRLGGCFIFDRNIPERREPRNVLPTLAHSLALVYPPYRDHVISVLKSDREIAKKSTVDQLSSLFPSNKIKLPNTPLIFAVDALDECAMDEKLESDGTSARAALATRLVEIAKRVPWLKVIITSRPTTEILEVFGEDGSESLSVTSFDLNTVDDVRNDIYKFNETWLKSVRKLDGKWAESDNLWRLTDRANGLFIWSSTVRDYVLREFDCNVALDKLMEKTETETDQTFATLNKLYQFVLEQVGGDGRVLKSALGMLASTTRIKPLTQDTLFELVPYKFRQERLTKTALETIFQRLQSVLYIDINGVVRICHPSFLDFLNSKDRAGDFWTDPAEVHILLVQQCIHLMISNLKFNICKLDSAYVPNREVQDLQTRISTNIPESLQYSCVYWMHHLLLAKETGLMLDASVRTMIRDFLCSIKCVFWLEAMSLMEKVEAATDALSHCFHSFDDEELSSVSRDLFKFATTFSDVIETSVPHIYISALSWAPVDGYPLNCISTEFSHQPATMISGKARRWKPILWSSTVWGGCESIQFSPDGNHAAVDRTAPFSKYKELAVFDTRSRQWVARFSHSEEFPDPNHVRFSLDSKNLLMSNLSGVLLSWNIATREKTVITLEGVDKVDDFCLYPIDNEIAIVSKVKSLCICNLSTKKCKFGPIDLRISASCIHYSPKGEYLAIGFADGSIQVMNPSNGVLKRQFLPDEGSRRVEDLVFLSDSGLVCSMYSDSKILKIWNILTGRLSNELIHMVNISSVTTTPDGCFIITAVRDGSIFFWQFIHERGEISPRKCILNGSYGESPRVGVSPDGRYLFTCSDDEDLHLLSLPDALREIAQQDDVRTDRLRRLSSIDCSPNGTIVSTHRNRSIFSWNLETGQKSGEPIFGIHTFAQFSPSGGQIVSCNGSDAVVVWDLKTKERYRTLDSTETVAFEYCFYSHDGRYIIALATLTKRIYVWDSATGECLRNSGDTFICGPGEVLSVSDYDVHDFTVSPIKHHVIFMDDPLEVHYIYDFSSGAILFTINVSCEYSVSVYSPDGMEIANVRKNALFFYDALTGAALGEPITLGINMITEVIYSSDGKHLILASRDSEIRIFEKESQEVVIGPIKSHTQYITRMKLSRPDGRYLVTGSIDGTVRIWDMDLIMKLSKEDLNAVINVYEDGTHSIGVESATAVNKDKSISRRIMPRYIRKYVWGGGDGWYRNAEGGLLFWIPSEYRMDATDLSKICIPATARRELNFDLERLSRYEGPNWVNIYPALCEGPNRVNIHPS